MIIYKKWLWSSTADLHGNASRDFASPSRWEQEVTDPTHIDVRVLDLVLTDIPDGVGLTRQFKP